MTKIPSPFQSQLLRAVGRTAAVQVFGNDHSCRHISETAGHNFREKRAVFNDFRNEAEMTDEHTLGQTVPVKIDSEQQRKDPVPVRQVSKTWWEAFVYWTLQQGVSTVLLFTIIFGVPRYMLPAIQSGYERNAASYEKATQLRIEASDRIIKVLVDGHDRDRATFERAIEAIERRP